MTNNDSSWIKRTLPLWTGQFISLFGSGIVQFSIVWYLTERTGSKVVLALATYMAIVPGILLGSAIGHFVDKYNRKITMILADIISASMILVMVILLYFDMASIPIVLFLMLIRSISSQFQSSALFASIPQLVPEKSLENVAGLRQTMDGILNIVSIPIAAFLLSILNIHSILSIDIVTAIIGICLLIVVRIPNNSVSPFPDEKKDFKKLIEGFKLLVSYKYIFYKSLSSASVNLALTPVFAFLPLLVKNNLQKGSETLALFQISSGIGFVFGGLLMSSWGGFKKRMRTMLLGLGLLGFSLLSGGIITNLGYSNFLVIPMFFLGLSLSISNSCSGAITQSKVKSEDIGKVSGASSSISQLMIPVGLLIATPVTEIIGITGWFIFAGLFILLIVIISSFNQEYLKYSFRGEKLNLERV